MQDDHGNFIRDIGDSQTMFASHIDTADRAKTRVRRVVQGDYIMTDKATLLGADDRAGMAVMLHLMRNNIPGKYVFFVGEEAGRVGSVFAERGGISDKMERIICWDRFGTKSIVTHQMGQRSCSDEFAFSLAEAYAKQGMTLELDEGGTYTDSYTFIDTVPECTNISIGYFGQHTVNEVQDARFLVDMAEASLGVPWDALPTQRDPYVPDPIDKWDFYTSNYQAAKHASISDMTSDDLIQAAQWGTLLRSDVENFLFENPEEAATLLYDTLTGGIQ